MPGMVRYLRPCNHVNDAVLFTVTMDKHVRVYCMECLMEKLGLEPCETLTMEQFAERYGGK